MIDSLETYVPPFAGEPGDWEDVLRRARRRGPSRRVLAVAAAVAVLLGAAPALAVLVLRSPGPQLPRDRIAGVVKTALDPRTGVVLLEAGRWKKHDGVCYLVPHVRAGCLARGARTRLLRPLPLLTRGAPSERGIRLKLHGRVPFAVVAVRDGVELRAQGGKVLARLRFNG